ncbi:MAG: tRNA (adenosine(37)-N6)-threonylcarbamoyltransferase complex transferase subunit TsaD, partial [Ruminococcus sp.]|nr:tRNA (adenosine(37)-N6)-threonylcarbamoyltransferase complex transferase subunit TsaD [Ruminococcus sp.]
KTLSDECRRRGWEFYMPDKKWCGDNAAMVGSQGYYEYLSGNTADTDLNAYATMSIE